MAKSNIPDWQLRDCTTGKDEIAVSYGMIKQEGSSDAIKPADAPNPPILPFEDDEASERVVNLE